jgi:hypothetical protein
MQKGELLKSTFNTKKKTVCEKSDEPYLCAQHLAPVIQVKNVVAHESKEKQKQ